MDLALDDELERGWRLTCIGSLLSDCALDVDQKLAGAKIRNPRS